MRFNIFFAATFLAFAQSFAYYSGGQAPGWPLSGNQAFGWPLSGSQAPGWPLSGGQVPGWPLSGNQNSRRPAPGKVRYAIRRPNVIQKKFSVK